MRINLVMELSVLNGMAFKINRLWKIIQNSLTEKPRMRTNTLLVFLRI